MRLLKIIRKNVIFFILPVALIMSLTLAVPVLADIYKYVDENGVAHFTNVPTDAKYKRILKEERVQFRLGPNFEKYDLMIMKAAKKYGLDYALIKAIIKAESNFNPMAVSRVGARGLMQLMPKTAYAYQVYDSFHPEENVEGGVRYLRYLINLFKGNMYLALAAYNAGEKAVYRYSGIPPFPETRTFIKRVVRYFQEYSAEPAQPDPSMSSAD